MANANVIDISYFQDSSELDWQAIKDAGIEAVIIRAGYGKTQDTQAAAHIANANKYGLKWHLYHYWYNMGGEAEWAVQNAKSLGLTSSQYLFLDMEDKSLPADWNGQFAVFRKAVGDIFQVGLYCSDSPYKAKFQDSQLQQLKVYRWVASYSYEPANYDMWQMSGAGSGGFGKYTADIDRDFDKSRRLIADSEPQSPDKQPIVPPTLTTDMPYIRGIVSQPGFDTESGIWGYGYSPDNGEHFYVNDTVFGRKYRQEDADRLWPYLKDFVSKQVGAALSVSWSDIKDKPDLALKSDIPSLNDYAKKTDIPQAPDLTGYAKLTDIPSVTGLVKEAELADYAKLADVPKSMSWNQITDKPILALKSDIPNVSGFLKQADLADYAKKTDIPKTPDLSVYAKKSDIPSLDGYAKMSDLPSVTGLVKQTDLVGYAKLSDIPKPPDLTPYAKTSEVDEVKATADSALSNAEKAQSTADANTKALADKANKSEIPDISGLAKKSDIPVLPDLNSYALKSELPSLSGYARLSDIPSVAGLVKEAELADYAKKSDIPAPVDLSGYAKTDAVDAVKTVADKAQSTADANAQALASKADRSELPVVPTDLVHTAEMEQVKAEVSQNKQLANQAVTVAKNAKAAIDTSDEFTVKKPSEYSEGFSHELKRVAVMIPDRSDLIESAQAGTIGILSTVSYGGYAHQTLKVLDSQRPMTFIRNGSVDTWYPWETVTTTITVD